MQTNEFLFHEDGYMRHNKARQDHLASLNLPINEKTVLEVGAGIGDHTGFFLDRGCRITSTDGRSQNVTTMENRFRDHLNVQVALLDVCDPPFHHINPYQIVYCYGLLYHCTSPSEVLAFLSLATKEMLLLETCVSAKDGMTVDSFMEESTDPRAAIHGVGCHPTRAILFLELKKHFPFVYFTTTQPNHDEFPLDWEAAKTATGNIRCVIIASKVKLDNPLLIESIPMTQTR